MNLWCEACNDLHHITNGNAEALIYALEADAREDSIKVRPGPDEATCLKVLVEHAYDSEGYAEHVEACKGRRLDLEKERGIYSDVTIHIDPPEPGRVLIVPVEKGGRA